LPGQAFRTGKRPYQRLRSADFNKDVRPDRGDNRPGSRMPFPFCLGMARAVCGTRPGSPFPAGKAPWAVAIDDMNHDGNSRPGHRPLCAGRCRSEGHRRHGFGLGGGKGGFRKMPGSPFSLAGCEGPDRVRRENQWRWIAGHRGDLRTKQQADALSRRARWGLHDGTESVQTGWAGVAVADSKDVAKTTSWSRTGFWIISRGPFRGRSRSFREGELGVSGASSGNRGTGSAV